jgi:hypothetical protein
MTCDWCERELPDDYVPPVDARGNPQAPTCRRCELGLVFSRAKRLERLTGDTSASAGGKETT